MRVSAAILYLRLPAGEVENVFEKVLLYVERPARHLQDWAAAKVAREQLGLQTHALTTWIELCNRVASAGSSH